MKKFAVGLSVIIAIAVFSYFFPESDRGITNAPARGTTIIAFGDSLVEGVGATKGRDFVSLLSRETGLTIENLGKSGDTTESGLARLGDVIARKPDVVLLLLGGNDFLRNVPLEDTFRNISTIIDQLHAAGAVVVLLGVRGGILADEFGSEFERIAETKSSAFVPNVLQGLIGHQDLMSDAIHPNNAGYARIAEKVLPELLRVLPE